MAMIVNVDDGNCLELTTTCIARPLYAGASY